MSTECHCGDQDYTTGGSGSVSCTMTNCGGCPVCSPRFCPCCGRRIYPYWPQPYRPWVNPWWNPGVYPTWPYGTYTVSCGDGDDLSSPNMTITVVGGNGNSASDLRA